MRTLVDQINEFVREQDISRLSSKVVLSDQDYEYLRELLEQQSIDLQMRNSALRNEVSRLNQLLGSALH